MDKFINTNQCRPFMADPKGAKMLAPKIRELADTGEMSSTEIASTLGTSAAYVRTVMSRAKTAPPGKQRDVADSATLGSEMAALREVMREVSTSARIDAVVRAFGQREIGRAHV